ncbi:MAG: glycyl-radical enzyme activating protein [Desulfobacterales bacterium]|nr:glycyl-radical enzyme activating protein [Desulfobacterales bacterium]
MNGNDGIIFKIKKFAIHDGPGIRTTIFLKGCPLSCWWCHNPEGIGPEPRVMEKGEATAGRERVIGAKMSVDAVVTEIEKDVIFYDESGGGATFSGGEPLFQAEFLRSLLEACAEREIHTTLDTTGFASPAVFSMIADLTDLVLFDLKIMDDARHVRYTGVSNKPILENLENLTRKGKEVVIRFPVIPGITDGEDNVRRMAEFARGLDRVKRIDLLPFHKIADAKYRRLGVENRMKGVTPPSAARIADIQTNLENMGFQINVGG